jgi:hypothetical protein
LDSEGLDCAFGGMVGLRVDRAGTEAWLADELGRGTGIVSWVLNGSWDDCAAVKTTAERGAAGEAASVGLGWVDARTLFERHRRAILKDQSMYLAKHENSNAGLGKQGK